MEIKDFLRPEHVLLDTRAATKAELLRELAERAASAIGIPAERIRTALLRREALGSTGTGGGIAIPHARLKEVRDPFGILARLRGSINFEAVDGAPVDVVFMLLLPSDASKSDLAALAGVARALRNQQIVSDLRAARDREHMYKTMTSSA
jgi:PTS system nitrogen regulatory IIA component